MYIHVYFNYMSSAQHTQLHHSCYAYIWGLRRDLNITVNNTHDVTGRVLKVVIELFENSSD